ncbi:MAG: GMC family oxidoreductase [Deltaproteobacteria bacterium]|nr:GMC family oxidoreductase [Deltaproteobacteria bacterium]
MSTHYDVIIIGSGAGGGTLAWKLAPTGKRILLLERGDYLPREPDNWRPRAVHVEEKYHTTEQWTDKDGTRFRPGTGYWVGGNTKVYGAALVRLRPRDFGEVVHHGGVAPAWPIGYDELEPYYTQAEHLYEVHGTRGEDPTDGPASAPYRFPAVSHEPRLQQLHDDLTRLGHHPFHLPVGVRLDESNPRTSACIRCATCDSYPCLLRAKSDAEVLCVEPALAHPNVTLLTNAYVERLETDGPGRRVTAVQVSRAGGAERYSADLVVVACGAVNSAALLLRSATERHPHGLANASGVVGRHYMAHTNSMFLAISRDENPSQFTKTFGLNDFYFGDRDWEYPMGSIQSLFKMDPETLAAGAPRLVPGMTLELMARHSLDLWVMSEDLPDPQNRVTLDADGGIRLSYTPNNLEGHRRLVKRLKGLLRQIGCEDHLLPLSLHIAKQLPVAGVGHQNGTIRFGRDPRSSALDVFCKSHELDNLYVVDASFFPSCGATNPSLTIMANALRVGDHLVERMG